MVKGVNINEDLVTNDDVGEFFQALETYCASDVLLSISLHDSNFEDRGGTLDRFESLLSFRNLRELDFLFHYMDYQLDNASIKTMTTAWPHMRRFSLVFDADWGTDHRSEITLDGLVPMAKNWPQLEHLALSLCGELSVDEVPLLKPGDGSYCSNIQSIDVGYSFLQSDPGAVAAFLTAIFPNLHHIDYYNDDLSTNGWSLVTDIVRIIGKVRRQERAHAARAK